MSKTKVKKSPFNINNIYSEGLKLRQSVPTAQARFYGAMSEPANTGMFNTVSSDYAPDLTYQENYNLYPNIDENGEISTVTEDDFKKKDNSPGLFGEGGTIDQLYTEVTNPMSVWRQGWKHKFESQKSHEETALKNAVLGLNDLDVADKYISEFEQYSDLIKQRDSLLNSGADQNTIGELDQKISEKINSIKELDDYVKKNWKSSDNFLKLFTDTSDMSVDKSIEYTTRGDSYSEDKSGTFWGTVKNIASYIGSLVSKIPNTVQNTVARLTDRDEYDAQIMKNSYNDEYDKAKYFDSVTKHLNDADLFIKNTKANIKKYREEQQRIVNEKSADLIRTNNIVKNGNWLFDPNKIDKHYQELQEGEANNGLLNILNPIKWGYMLPEIGSSFADMETFFELIAAGKFAQLAGTAADLANPIGGVKGKALKYILKATALAGAAGSMYLATQSRKVETESEVADAYLQRIVNSLYDNKNNINVNKVFKSIDDFANNLPGLDKNTVKNMNVEDKIRLALAYNVNTGDKGFEELKQKFRPGLAKVYNENNGLSVMDYIQTMPYMTYAGKVFKKAIGSKVGNSFEAITGKKLPNITERVNKAAQALSDRTINAVFSNNAQNIYKKILASRSAKWLTKQAKALAHVGFFEGVEEGQQQLLQSRYQRGEYDDYREPYSMFDIPSAINDIDLGVDAVFDYLGLRPGDPDNLNAELIKSMNIGAGTGGIFHGIHVINPISNALSGKYDEYTLRGFAGQLKNDYVLRKLIGEHYGKAEDDAHVKIFYNMLQQKGYKVDPVRMAKTFQEMKRFKGELVDDEFINRDQDLFNATYFVHNNKALADTLKEIGITENTDDELKITQNAVRALVDDKTLSKLIDKQNKAISQNQEDIENTLGFYLDNRDGKLPDGIPEEYKQKVDLYQDLITMLSEGYSNYKDAVAKRNDKSKIEEQAKKELDYDKKKEGLKNDTEGLKKLDEELKDKVKELTEDTISEKDYIKNRISMIFAIRKLDNLKNVRKLFKDRLQLNKYINQELGLDLNIDRLGSIVQNLDNILKSEEKQINDVTKADDAQIDKYNAWVKQENQRRKEYNYKNRRNKKISPVELLTESKHILDQFRTNIYNKLNTNIFDEYDRNIKNMFINTAMRDIFNPYVTLYRTGVADPRIVAKQLKSIKWSWLSEEQKNQYRQKYREAKGQDLTEKQIASLYQYEESQKHTELYKLIDEYKEAKKAYDNKSEEDRTVSDEIDLKKKSDEIIKKAGKYLIQYDLKQKRDRQRISHQEFLNDGGVTLDDVERAENGDTKAQEDIASTEAQSDQSDEQTTEQTSNKETTQSQETQTNNGTQTNGENVDVEQTSSSDLYSGQTSIDQLTQEQLDRGRRRKPKENHTEPESKPEEKPAPQGETEKPGVAAVEQKLDEQDQQTQQEEEKQSEEKPKDKIAGEGEVSATDLFNFGTTKQDNTQEKHTLVVTQVGGSETETSTTSTENEGQKIYNAIQNGEFSFSDLLTAPFCKYDIDGNTRVVIDEYRGIKYVEVVNPNMAETSYVIPIPDGYIKDGITGVKRLAIENGQFEAIADGGVHILQREQPEVDPHKDVHNPDNSDDSSSDKTDTGKHGMNTTEESDHDISEDNKKNQQEEPTNTLKTKKAEPSLYDILQSGNYTVDQLQHTEPGIYLFESGILTIDNHENQNDDISIEFYVDREDKDGHTESKISVLNLPVGYGTSANLLGLKRIYVKNNGEVWGEDTEIDFKLTPYDTNSAIQNISQKIINGEQIDIDDILALPEGTYNIKSVGTIKLTTVNLSDGRHTAFSIYNVDKDGYAVFRNIQIPNGYISDELDSIQNIIIDSNGNVYTISSNKVIELSKVQPEQKIEDKKSIEETSTQKYDDVKDKPKQNPEDSEFADKINQEAQKIDDDIEDFNKGQKASDELSEMVVGGWDPIVDGRTVADYTTTHVDYISQTFFYLNSRYDNRNNENGPMRLSVRRNTLNINIDGKLVDINSKIQPGWKLAQKLLDYNWLKSKSVKKFYIVSGNDEGSGYRTNSYTVAMCLQDTTDDNKIYVVTLKTPNYTEYKDANGRLVIVNNYNKLIQQLLWTGINYDLYKTKEKEVVDAYKKVYPDYDFASDTSDTKTMLIDRARKLAHNGRSHFFTRKEIEENVSKLVESRNKIIEAYCKKDAEGHYIIPDTVRTDVVPQDVRQSCGQLYSERDSNNMPVFKNLNNKSVNLGVAEDIERIQQQLEDGSVQLGYGTGEYSENPYTILPLFGDNTYNVRRGYAGKIYLMYEAEGTRFPITLREQRFEDIPTENGFELRIDPETGLAKQDTLPPCAAEILLYLLTGKLNTEHFPGRDKTIAEKLLNLFLFNGDKTTRTSQRIKSVNKKVWYADKWINFEDGQLSIVVKENGARTIKHYKVEEIFGNDSKSISNRKNIVYAISKNMHWNTDKDTLSSTLDDELLDALRTEFDTSGRQVFKLCGLEQFSFRKSDFFNEDGSKKNVSVLAWMISNGKLMTDITPQIFKDPFVFANGVNNNNTVDSVIKEQTTTKPAEKKEKESKKQELKPVKPEQTVKEDQVFYKFDENKVSNIKGNTRLNLDRLRYDESQRNPDESISKDTVTDPAKVVMERLLIDMSSFDFNNKENNAHYKFIENKIKEFAKKISFQINGDIEFKGSFKNQQVSSFKNGTRKPYVPVVYMYKNGIVKVTAQTKEWLTTKYDSEFKISGLYSREKGKGKFNKKKALKWLQDKLGLTEEKDVFVTEGLLKMMDGKEVYGVVEPSAHTVGAIMELSEEGGKGLEYHEAWHWVNMLLHTREQRIKMYNAYCEAHPKAKTLKYREIEELLAEDFRSYALYKNNLFSVYTLKRAYKNIANFVSAVIHLNWKIRTAYNILRSEYKSINDGEYRNNTIDEHSFNAFKARYEYINSEFYIPTVSEKAVRGFKNIGTYQQFYKVCESLANKLLDYCGISRIEDFNKANGASFDELISELKDMCEEEEIEGVIDDIYNNKKMFFNIVKNIFAQYGIKAKLKKLKQLKEDENKEGSEEIDESDEIKQQQEDENAEKADIGDAPDNVWDRFQFETSKKDNVASRAKLFLTHLRSGYLETQEDGSKKLIYNTDDLLHSPIYMPFGEVWTRILEELWSAETYDAKDEDGNYFPTSLRGMIDSRKENDALYRILDERLSELDGDPENGILPDIQLQNQILNTVKSQKPQMAYMQIEDPYNSFSKESVGYDMIGGDLDFMQRDATNEDIDDIQRSWKIQNDNTLRAQFSLPKRWSNSIVQSGMVKNDKNGTTVNDTFVSQITNKKKIGKYDILVKLIDNIDKNSVKTNIENDEIINKLIDLFNYLSIPIDDVVIEHLISQMISTKRVGSPEARFEVLKSIVKNSKDKSSLYNIINTLDKSRNKKTLYIDKSGKHDKNLFDLYTGFKQDSFIRRIATAYHEVHPSSSDFSVKGPDGSMHYPISQNNHMSDQVRELNTDKQAVRNKMAYSYAQNSLIFRKSLDIKQENSSDYFVLNAFIGIKDTRKQQGKDYFGISFLEDYLAKMMMTHNDMLTLPTMADKKTWYAIQCKLLKLPHDLITYDITAADGTFQEKRFSTKTLNIFAGYWNDEINTLLGYYDRSTIEELKNNPNKRRKNYHGKFKNGRMDFSGNGGIFRYMYDIEIKNGMNLNEYLQSQYEIQKKIEADGNKYGGLNQLREIDENGNQLELDGFELVRKALIELKEKYNDRSILYDSLNKWLFQSVEDEIDKVTTGPYRLGMKDKQGRFIADAIPVELLKYYKKKFDEAKGIKTKDDNKIRNPYSDADMLHNYSLSVIANHRLSTMISIIELEKVFAGDPAFYKYAYKKEDRKVIVKQNINGKERQFTIGVRQLDQKDADKIKRLGALLSPGSNIRTEYGESVTNNKEFETLKGDKYTVLNVSDFKAKSLFLEEMKTNFKRQSIIEYLRDAVNSKKIPEWFQKFLEENKNEYQSAEKFFLALYHKQGLFQEFENIASKKEYKKYKKEINTFFNVIEQAVDISVSPYEDITVSDAQVIIRPELYRKIRIGLGEWSFEEDDTGYSDEKAYHILEEDGSWMHDEEKAKLVSKLELYPLKMSYFQNSPEKINDKVTINLPIYNKMAIFPMFKYMTQSQTGKALYDRMNDSEQGYIDMMAFDSAVKVGDIQNKYSTYDKNDTHLEHFNFEGLNKKSDRSLDKSNNVVFNSGNDTLGVQIQSLTGLRMQLNTEAHKDMERKIGSQMFKIAFSNIVDTLSYGSNRVDQGGNQLKPRNGSNIKHDIMFCINALTNIGEKAIQEEFEIDKKGGANKEKVRRFIKRVIENNNLGVPSQEIFDTTGCAASLTSRRVFEQSAVSLINREVVAIETNGGTAVQQSMFGLVGFDQSRIKGDTGYTQDGYRLLNDGKELKWSTKNNTIEVMVSINQFRSVLPKNLRKTSFEVRRQWLIDHDIIKGAKSKEYWRVSEKDSATYQALQTKINDLNISERLRNVLKPHKVNTIKDIIDNKSKYESYLDESLSKELIDVLDNVNLSFDTNTNIQVEKTRSNPQPIGIGYRIPTQGLSSMFAFTCADVISEQSGDLIIVPREFTAQTGSDFDVDKLFISILSYEDGKYCDLSKEDYDKIQEIYNDKKKSNKQQALTEQFSESKYKKALQNRLLQNYIAVLTDEASYAAMRSSIDTTTGRIKHELLPLLQTSEEGYRKAGYELSPYFQMRRKMEFTIGKSGIGPFALNITNMALTQFAHLTLVYKDSVKDFNLGDLDAITSKDETCSRISDWLSAMVNAHVDVAKDPYIFDMNINNATYMYINFLLRAGKAMSTFTYIAQPAIKDLAAELQNSKAMYGDNIKSRKQGGKSQNKAEDYKEAKKLYGGAYMNILSKYQQVLVDFLNNNKEYLDKNLELKAVLIALTSSEDAAKQLLGKKIKINYKSIFDEQYSKKMLLAYKNREKQPLDINFYIYQVLCLKTWQKLKPYAEELSSLVNASRIDTEKFGNNIPAQLNYINDYNSFIKGNRQVSWKINKAGEDWKEKLKENKSYALNRYFNNSFLSSKLYKATGLVKVILRNQLFTATGPFESIYKTFMCNTVGSTKLSDGTIAYDKIYDEKIVTTVAQAIENVMRYQSMVNVEQQINQEEQKALQGFIDFTCNNNPQEVYDKLYSLIFGDEEYAKRNGDVYKYDIFKRVSNLIHTLNNFNSQRQGVQDQLEEFVDVNGNLKNEFLKFITPQTASYKFPIGRFLLSKSAFSVTKQEESALVSAFDQLLRSKNDNVRRLARDLVFYSYYAHYDNNSPQSFFNLVPPYYRQQYDKSLRSALNKSNIDLLGILNPINENVADYYMDVISRNYWYDDNIVHTQRLIKYGDKGIDNSKTSEITLVSANHHYNGLYDGKYHNSTIKGVIISTNFEGRSYVKIQYGKDYYIYKKIGSLNKTPIGDDKKIEPQDFDVYVVVPKLGIYENGLHQHEFNGVTTTKSLFKTNQLPSALKLDNLLQHLNKWIEDNNTKFKDKLSLEFTPLDLNLEQFTDYLPPTDNEYFKSFKPKFINISSIKSRDSIASTFKSNVIDFSNNGKDVYGQVKELYNSKQGDYITLSLSIIGNYNTEVSEKLINDKIKELTDAYQVFLDREEPDADHSQEIQDYKKSLNIDLIKDDLIKDQVYDYVSKIMDKITDEKDGFPINSLKVDGSSNVGRAVAKYRELNPDRFRYAGGDISNESCQVYVKRSMFKSNISLQMFYDQFTENPVQQQLGPKQQEQLEDATNALQAVQKVQDNVDLKNTTDTTKPADTTAAFNFLNKLAGDSSSIPGLNIDGSIFTEVNQKIKDEDNPSNKC